VQCGDPPVIPNGFISVSFNGAGSEGTLVCNSSYSTEGSSTYRCTEQGDWVGNERCGMLCIIQLQVYIN